MFGAKRLKELNLCKQVLTLESELNRLSLRAECGQLRKGTSWLTQPAQIFRQRRSSLLVLATIAGLLLARLRPASSEPAESHQKTGSRLRLLLDVLQVLSRT